MTRVATRLLGTAALVLLAACSRQSGEKAPPYLVYVTNEGSGDVSVIDPIKRAEIDRIAIGKRPRGLVVSPDGKLLYVAVSGSPAAGPGVDESKLPPPDRAADGVAVVDLATRRVVRTLRGISDPEQIAISPDGERLYVASEDSGVLVILGRDGNRIGQLAVGGEPEGVAVSPDGATVLATSEEDSSLAIIRGAPPAVAARVKVGTRPRSAAFLNNTHAVAPGENDASLSVVDLHTGRLTRRIELPRADRPMGIAVIGGTRLVMTTGRGGRLVRIDTGRADAVTGAVAVGVRPWGVALAPDRSVAFTANGSSNDVTLVDIANMKVVGKVKVGTAAWGVAVR
ncbi:hypothetical protein [Sphingomonas sp.]|jgi:YVTN family beta-propeller protein|uniref:YVTN family beta-propeller repeat protein n=1 Tax=Sphingomonas sp. TaxID=28214 RepID=UPI002EDB6DDE